LSRAPSGPAGDREGGCGTVTLDDEEGHRLATVRDGRAPEAKKKTLTAQLDAERSSILAVRPDLPVVAIADGTEENWRSFDRGSRPKMPRSSVPSCRIWSVGSRVV
jgi:hypothetical protein